MLNVILDDLIYQYRWLRTSCRMPEFIRSERFLLLFFLTQQALTFGENYAKIPCGPQRILEWSFLPF
jgi:hypothetical protein